jgi:hypothetical protein
MMVKSIKRIIATIKANAYECDMCYKMLVNDSNIKWAPS